MSKKSSISKDYTSILKSEGKIKFYLPIYANSGESSHQRNSVIGKSMPVFFNERMALNRDLTLLMVKIYSNNIGRKISFLDAMASTGVRAIRLLKETDIIKEKHGLFINDLNPLAVKYIHKNMKLNKIKKNRYRIFNEDARRLMGRFRYLKSYNKEEKEDNFCDVIDIDPFGTPSHYIPAAMQCIELGGLLCITATDTPVLFGIRKETCVRKYLTKPIRVNYSKELGTRILIYYVAKIGHLFKMNINPVLSISSDHFIRVFLVIKRGIKGVNKNMENFGRIIYCQKCGFRKQEKFKITEIYKRTENCPLCNSIVKRSGLLWIGNLHSAEYRRDLMNEVERTNKEELPSYNRIKKYLDLSADEDKEYPPYYYVIPKIADSLTTTFPSMKILQKEFINRGFKVTRTHFNPQALKTDANIREVKEIITDSRKNT
ncbi:MAG: tRNA (guanine(10)-N(2))-dimethyltransferase [Promethearchaeota archaeon]